MLTTSVLTALGAVLVIIGVLAWLSAHGRIGPKFKIAALALFSLAIPASLAPTYLTLGAPMYQAFQDIPEEGYVVLWYQMVKDDGIYMIVDGSTQPFYYKLIWDKDLAEFLEEQQANPANAHATMKMKPKKSGMPDQVKQNAETSWSDNKTEVWLEFPDAAPPKDVQSNSTMTIFGNTPTPYCNGFSC